MLKEKNFLKIGFLLVIVFILFFAKLANGDRLIPNLLDPNLKGVPFGAEFHKFVEFLKERVREKYRPLIQSTMDIRETERLKKEMEEEVEKTDDNVVKFKDDKKSVWKISVVGEEYEQGTDDMMLIKTEGVIKYYFFFKEDRLWKVIKTLPVEEKKFSDFILGIANVYGPPDEIKYSDPEKKTSPSKAIWESQFYRFVFEDKIEIYKCVKIKWTDRVFEDEIIAKKKKIGEEEEVSPIIKSAIIPSSSEDINNVVDEILGIKQKKEEVEKKEEKKKGIKKYREKR